MQDRVTPHMPRPFSPRVGHIPWEEGCPGLPVTHPNVRVPVTGSVGHGEVSKACSSLLTSPLQPGEALASHGKGNGLPTKPVLSSTTLATPLPSLDLEMQPGSLTHLVQLFI